MTSARDEPEKLDALLALYGLKRILQENERWTLKPLDDRPVAFGGGEWNFSQPLEVYLEAFRLREVRHNHPQGLITMSRALIEYIGGARG